MGDFFYGLCCRMSSRKLSEKADERSTVEARKKEAAELAIAQAEIEAMQIGFHGGVLSL